METSTLDLRPQPAAPTARFLQRITLALLGMVNILLAIATHNIFRYASLGAGVTVLVVAVLFRKIYKPRILTFNGERIFGSFGRDGEAVVAWKEIDRLELKGFVLSIVSRTGKRFLISMADITVQQEREIIPRLIMVAKSQGVKTEFVQ
jgi:hypothetical protein